MLPFMITFNNMDMPDFLRVKAINTSALPEINNSFKTVAGGWGSLDTGTTVGGKKIEVEFTIVIPKDRTLLDMQRDLSYWLMGDGFKLSPLVISDECQLEYMAKVNNQVDITDQTFTGEGKIEFIIPKGVAVNRNTIFGANESGNKIVADYLGTAPAYPVFEFTPSMDLKNKTLKIVHVNSGDVFLAKGDFKAGETFIIDCNKKLVKKGGILSLDMIVLESDWLKLQGRRMNEFTYNLDGKCVMSYQETWV